MCICLYIHIAQEIAINITIVFFPKINRYYILSGLTYTSESVSFKIEVTTISKSSKVMSIQHLNMSSIKSEMG